MVTEVRKLGPDDLSLVGCIFLVSPTFKESNIISLKRALILGNNRLVSQLYTALQSFCHMA